jgi:hypothetical protein
MTVRIVEGAFVRQGSTSLSFKIRSQDAINELQLVLRCHPIPSYHLSNPDRIKWSEMLKFGAKQFFMGYF